VLSVDDVRDLAWVTVDGTRVGTLERAVGDLALGIPAGREVKLLVEEGGRVNYDVKLGQPKGLIGVPRVGGVAVAGPWQVRTIDVPALAQAVLDAAAVTGATGGVAGPAGLRATFTLDAESDLFLDTAGWGKGYAWVNGFFLGRYWSRGPQRTLYVPKPATRAGENTVIVVELAAMTDATARFVARPDLGHHRQ
jgi:beta-galactosidase